MTPTALKRLRRRLGLTQVAFAERIGIHPNSYARMERGELGIHPARAQLMRVLVEQMEPKRKTKKKKKGRMR